MIVPAKKCASVTSFPTKYLKTLCYFSFIAAGADLSAAAFTVNSSADTNTGVGTAGTLRYCINQANNTAGPNSITFTAPFSIALGSSLPPIGANITSISNGGFPNTTISGGNQFQAFALYSGATVSFVGAGSIALQNCASVGGAGGSGGYGGGGGGMGAGGGIFLPNQSNATITGLSFSGCSAVGGAGGVGAAVNGGGGGGGGMSGGAGGAGDTSGAGAGGGGGGYGGAGGSGLNGSGGGGGGGIFFTGGVDATGAGGGGGGASDANNGGNSSGTGTGGNGGTAINGDPGGAGGSFSTNGGSTTTNGGGGGGGPAGNGGSSNLGGGGGGAGFAGAPSSNGGNGGGSNGPFGGGGGGGAGGGFPGGLGGTGGNTAAISPTVAPGGGGGGGGGATDGSSSPGGNGGFGGGAGGAGQTTYTGGFLGNSIFGGGGGGGYSNSFSGRGGFGAGGGTSGGGSSNGGGGGAGLGGAIFIGAGSTLTIQGSFSSPTGSSVAGGQGGGAGAGSGQGLGTDIFVLSSGTINFQHTSPVTISSSIGSDLGACGGSTTTGGLIMSGSGTLTLGGANQYTGSTTMTAGVVQISNDANLGFLSPPGFAIPSATMVFGGGTLEMTQAVVTSRPVNLTGTGTLQTDSGTSVFGGVISGSGPIQITGAGKMAFLNANTYTGTTNIQSGGTLRIFGPANISTATVNFNNGTLELASTFGGRTLSSPIAVAAGGGTLRSEAVANDTVTLGGAISTASTFNLDVVNDSRLKVAGNITGAGGITKQGKGKLVLSGGANTYAGATSVTKGTLIVDGTITTSAMTVDAGAKLMGTGTTADVSLSGIVAPGHSIGTLNVGNFTFNTGSRYDVEINDTTSDLIASSGTVTINGGTLKLIPAGFTTPDVSSYTVISGTTVTANTPFTFVNPLTRYSFAVGYNPSSVVIQILGVVPFDVIVNKGNAGAVAKCFQTLVPLDLPDLTEIINILDLQTPAQMTHSFNQMHSANLNNVAFAEENVAERIRQVYTNHFFEQRVVGCPEPEAWRLWVAPFVERARQHGKGHLPGYLEQFAGFSAALDYHWQNHWMFTGGFSFASTEMNVPHGRTQANFNTYAGTLGTAWTDSRWFVDAQVAYLFSPIDEKRKMHFSINSDALVSTVNRTAKHEDDSNQVLGHIGGGYDFKMKSSSSSTFNIYPFANLDYIYIPQDSYTEHGAQSLDLKVHSKSYDLLRPEGGIGLGYYGCFKNVEALFDMSVSYIHEFRFLGEKTTARFKPSSCKFTVTGLKPENNLVSPQARLRLTALKSGFSLTLGYHGEYGEHFIMNAGEAELRKAF